MYKIVLLRHGQSQWNLENRFTGWTDVGLSQRGIEEAKNAGKSLKENGFTFDLAYTSYLKRAIKTLHYALEEMDELWVPEIKSWKLNERHYGALQGLNKAQTAEEYGKEKVHQWRRSYDVRPPLLTTQDERYCGKKNKYKHISKDEIPLGENLKDTVERVIPYWEKEISKQILDSKKIIIAAHGNSLRALVKHLENISEEEIPGIEIPTGKPLVYELDENLKVLQKYYIES